MKLSPTLIATALVAVFGAVVIAGFVGGASADSKITIVAYSTPQEAFKQLMPAFQATPAGTGAKFSQSYGSSGEQTRAITNGLPADIVELSHVGDMEKLVKAGKVTDDWDSGEHKGIVSDSVVVFAVRKGNPKKIRDWGDLVRPDVEVISANAVVSGGARWNLMAAYLQALAAGADESEATKYVEDLLANVAVQDKSARESLQTFSSGKGDVLLTYENEAIAAMNAGQDVEYVIPPTTLLVENPVATTVGAPAQAKEFLDFLYSDQAQLIFAEAGYRSINPDLIDEQKFPQPERLLTVDQFGGWHELADLLFDKDDGKVTKINESLGVSSD